MKKRTVSVFAALFLLLMTGCDGDIRPSESAAPTSSSPSSSGTAQPTQDSSAGDYFPILENVRYVYKGEGNEYASYAMTVDYADGARMQQRINNGGAETVRVFEVGHGKVTGVFSRGEVSYRENFLNKTDSTRNILLMEPIKAGTSWTLGDGSVRTITDVSAAADTPSGSYPAVSVETKGASGTTVDYYAKNIGLVKTVFSSEGGTVTSSLSSIEKDVPLVQTVRFYYPDINDGKLHYADQKISFKTNDITRKKLEEAYKTPVSGQPGKVFSANTQINSLYLNQDGMVYLDLNKAFVTEMNAGSGYESMILQSTAATFGSYYGVGKVLLTIDGGLYESGHILLQKGEYLTVQTDGAVPIS